MIRVALVHDWLTGMRGGEYVLEAIAGLFRQPSLFTLVCFPDKISSTLSALPTHTSFLQGFPGAEHRYRHLLPLMPKAIESFDLEGFDLIVSSSHCVAKGIPKPKDSIHLSYVHAPMRYMWDRYDEYFGPGRANGVVRLAAMAARPFLQRWDRRSSRPHQIDQIVCNSRFIAERVHSIYGRDSRVVYPFVDLPRFQGRRRPGKEYLLVGAFAPYKRLDVAIQAFNRLGLPLAIVGSGQDEGRLRAQAGATIRFLGALGNEAIAELYSTCRAFVFPGKEDFGITPLEAMASGAPVIAFGEGGAAETVTSETGVFFAPQSAASLVEAVERFEASSLSELSEAACRRRAAEFSRERFERELREIIRQVWANKGRDPRFLEEALRPA